MESSGTIWTDSGMCALWDQASFPAMVDYDAYVAALGSDERIASRIEAGAFVPVGIESDGVFGALVRVGKSATLTERESRYVTKTSDPYLFVCSGQDGKATADALPDLVILLVPDSGGPYRTERTTFEFQDLPMYDAPQA
jgi:hypothetical protein